MTEKYLKARIPAPLHDDLRARAAEAGQRFGTYVRERLESDAHAIETVEALARVERLLAQNKATSAVVSSLEADDRMLAQLGEVLLLARELALAQNAQILVRVAAKLQRGGAE